MIRMQSILTRLAIVCWDATIQETSKSTFLELTFSAEYIKNESTTICKWDFWRPSSFFSLSPLPGVVIVVLIVLILVSVIVGGLLWAYCHPNTTAGLWLIEHRPRRLKTKMMFWKNNGAEELEDMEGSPVRVGGGVETYNCAVDTTWCSRQHFPKHLVDTTRCIGTAWNEGDSPAFCSQHALLSLTVTVQNENAHRETVCGLSEGELRSFFPHPLPPPLAKIYTIF